MVAVCAGWRLSSGENHETGHPPQRRASEGVRPRREDLLATTLEAFGVGGRASRVLAAARRWAATPMDAEAEATEPVARAGHGR